MKPSLAKNEMPLDQKKTKIIDNPGRKRQREIIHCEKIRGLRNAKNREEMQFKNFKNKGKNFKIVIRHRAPVK